MKCPVCNSDVNIEHGYYRCKVCGWSFPINNRKEEIWVQQFLGFFGF